jgi:predicted dinucleotide-binding enzyme
VQIAVIGRGQVGGGLARLWRQAGHTVDEFGRDGGDASAADVVVVAVVDHAIPSALAAVAGVAGKPAIDVTNPDNGRPAGFPSLAHLVKSLTGGPVAKAFDTVFAAQYEEIAAARPAPSCLWSGDDEIAELVQTLIRDAGLDPVRLGDLESASAQEDFLSDIVLPLWRRHDRRPFFYRIEL